MKKIVIIGFVLAAVIWGCEKERLQNVYSSSLKTRWELSYIQNTRTKAILNFPNDAIKKISLIFTDSMNVLLFSGVCNSGNGRYSYSFPTNSIGITDLTITKKACKYIEWENYTVHNLVDAYQYVIHGDRLVLYSKGDYNLYFNRYQSQ